jgi:hypothetical protein
MNNELGVRKPVNEAVEALQIEVIKEKASTPISESLREMIDLLRRHDCRPYSG